MAKLSRILEQLEIPYFLGGSAASSIHGEARSTQDLDFIVDLSENNLKQFLDAINTDYFVDREAAAAALRGVRSFNILELETMFKIDIFPLRSDPLSQSEMRRRERIQLDANTAIWTSSQEDTILKKLLWFHHSAESLEQQLRDVRGVLKTQGKLLDMTYLTRMAEVSGIRHLLERVLRDCDLDPPK